MTEVSTCTGKLYWDGCIWLVDWLCGGPPSLWTWHTQYADSRNWDSLMKRSCEGKSRWNMCMFCDTAGSLKGIWSGLDQLLFSSRTEECCNDLHVKRSRATIAQLYLTMALKQVAVSSPAEKMEVKRLITKMWEARVSEGWTYMCKHVCASELVCSAGAIACDEVCWHVCVRLSIVWMHM